MAAYAGRLEMDLSGQKRTRGNIRALKASAAFTFGMVVLCGAGIAYQFLHFGNNAGSYLLSVILGVFAAVNLFLGWKATHGFLDPQAERMRITYQGIEIVFDDGTRRSYPWAADHTRFKIQVMNGPVTDGGPEGYLDLQSLPSIFLTNQEITQFLELIRNRGLRMTTKKDWVKYRGPATAYLVRGGA
jgi:hypothetical protein